MLNYAINFERSVTMYLSTITENDYREYRKCFTKVKYSITKKGEPLSYPIGLLHDSYMNVILGKGDFLDVVKNPQNSLFFYKDDTDETIEIVFLTFKGKICTIAEFSVFDHFNGNGTKLYKEVANLCREKGVYDIELWCPFEGAKEFWKKMGFYEKRDTHFYSRISKH